MKAAILNKLNGPLVVGDVEPRALCYGQVSVKVVASGICGAQLQEIAGLKGNSGYVPHLLGHEGFGIVTGIGDGVTRVAVDDYVVMHWRKASGIESAIPSFLWGDKVICGGRVTTFAESTVVSENRITKVPPEIPFGFASLLGCGLSTALRTLELEASLNIGESLLIIGVGGLGVNLLLAASILGAGYVSALDINDSKRNTAFKFGASEFSTWDNRESISNKYNVVVDTTGNPDAIAFGFDRLLGGGKMFLIGQPKPEESVIIKNARSFFDGEGKTIKATQGGGFKPDVDIPRYVNLWKSGRINVNGVISHEISIDEINVGVNLVREGHASRIIIRL